MRRKPLTDIT